MAESRIIFKQEIQEAGARKAEMEGMGQELKGLQPIPTHHWCASPLIYFHYISDTPLYDLVSVTCHLSKNCWP